MKRMVLRPANVVTGSPLRDGNLPDTCAPCLVTRMSWSTANSASLETKFSLRSRFRV
ncbi:hypothetical protein [Verminephrobacter eiseniae]|uniref:hypothetical protein n=1 Tax=Verminephrobacter eiseniae TaxID=364317 RepID=UPI0022388F3A|nr:hypothetical protein [Verminephrobacter eiseniae]